MTSPTSKNVTTKLSPFAFGALTILLVFGVLFLVKGFLHALILGIIGATMLMPMHRRICRWVKSVNRKILHRNACKVKRRLTREYVSRTISAESRMAALISVTVVFFVVVIPLSFFMVILLQQGQKTLQDTKEWLQPLPDGRTRLSVRLENLDRKYRLLDKWSKIKKVSQSFQISMMDGNVDGESDVQENSSDRIKVKKSDVETAKPEKAGGGDIQEIAGILTAVVQKGLGAMMKGILGFMTHAWKVIANFFIMLLIMFFAFRDGSTFIKYVRDISPLSDPLSVMILDRVSEVSRAVLYGILGTAVVQSLIAMVIFRIVHIPAVLWGSLLGLCSLIPFIGTSLVWVPIMVYFILMGQYSQAAIVLVGCGGVVANVDNFMRPAFICGGRTGMSYIVLFCSLLGGLQAFGLAGVIYGPLISGLCALCFFIFATRYKMRNME